MELQSYKGSPWVVPVLMAHGDFIRACVQIQQAMESIKMQNQNEPMRVLNSRNLRIFTHFGTKSYALVKGHWKTRRMDGANFLELALILVASILILVVFTVFFGAVYSKHYCQELSVGGKGNSRDKKFWSQAILELQVYFISGSDSVLCIETANV